MSSLAQPAVLRCLAGGHPKPFVTWWRGDKILPLKDDRMEITRDYSLHLTSVDLHDLGSYVCQAYNSIGRPVSIQVTLKVRGPVHARSDEDRKYLQYVDSEPYSSPSTYRPQTLPPTLPPRTRVTPHYVYNVTVARPGLGKFRLSIVFTPNRLTCKLTTLEPLLTEWKKFFRKIKILELLHLSLSSSRNGEHYVA